MRKEENFQKTETRKTEEEKKPLSLDDVNSLYEQYETDMEQVEEDYFNKKIDFSLLQNKKEQVLAEFIEKLMESKESLSRIFKTENGSTYFILKTGECLRFKRQKIGSDYFEIKPQPVMGNVIMIKDDDVYRITKEHLLEGATEGEVVLKKAEYTIGNTPFEMNFVHEWPDKLLIKEEADAVLIKGFGPYHVGHKIIEIIK